MVKDRGAQAGAMMARRVVERDYLRALSDVCPIETWRGIVTKAVEQAQAGDAQARAWLARYLCGTATLASSLSMVEQIASLEI